MMNFVRKHTFDRFFLIDSLNVSVRDHIAKELVSNILVHREFSSTFPARIIVEKDRIVAENWNRPLRPGRIDPVNFEPYPKNPILARFFVQIGYADTLGSGVRNLYKYTKIYSGGEPELIEGDVFKTIVPIGARNVVNGTVNEPVSETHDPVNELVNEPVTPDKLLSLISINPQIKYDELANQIGVSRSTIKREIKKLRERNIIKRVGSDKTGYWEVKSTAL